MSRTRIMLTKFTPPRIKEHILRRPGLAKKMRYILLNSFTLIHSGPGYGKSTMLSLFFADKKIPVCWYNIEDKDGDLLRFISHIVECIRREHREFGKDLLRTLESMEQVLNPDDVELLVYQFVNELMAIPQDVILVLDDYHSVLRSFFIDQWMQLVVRNLPHHVKIVIATRQQPLWPWLRLMKIRGEYFEINQKDLTFTEEETEALLLDEFRLSLSPEETKKIHQVTEGWALAIRLYGEKPDCEPQKIHEELLHFLDVEVLGDQEYHIQRFLEYTSVLDSFTKRICVHIIGQSADSLLDEISGRNLFISSMEDGYYRYHPIFRELLLNRLNHDPTVKHTILQSLASYYRKQEDVEKTLATLYQIEDWEQIGEVLVHYAEQMIRSENLEQLYGNLKSLPDHVKNKYYKLWFYQAEVARYRCIYPLALTYYDQFMQLAEQNQDVYSRCLGLEGKARVHLDSVQGIKAEELLKQAIQLLDVTCEELAPRLYRMLAEIYTNRGNSTEAEKWYLRSLELEYQAEVEIESRLYFRTGRLQSAIHLLEKKWNEEKRKGFSQLTRSYKETSLLLAFVYGMNGETEKGLDYAQKSIEIGKEANSPFVEANGYIRKAHLAMNHQDFTTEEVRHLYLKGLRMMEELQSTRGKAEALLGLTILHGREKSLDLALAYGHRGMQETEAIKDDWLHGLIRLGMGIAYAHMGKYEQARPVFTECVELFRTCGDHYIVSISYFWLSYLAMKQEDWASFVPAIREALGTIQSGEYSFLVERPTMFTPRDVQTFMPLLIEAQKRQIRLDYISQLLTDLGLQNVTFHPGYTLRIQTLGQFRIWLGDAELSEKAWQRGKAKQLFQLFLTKRQHLLAREEIFHYLWEESDEEAASRDFKVALNALNKALEPQREARASAFFVQRHGSSYGFNLASGYRIDAEDFERFVTIGLDERDEKKAIEYLEKGLAFYQGEYLPDCRYEDWCMEERERLHVLFLRGAEKLAQLYACLKQFDIAIRWCETILRTDDCWEEAYRLLMYCYYRKNNRAQSIRWYEKCVAKLQEQLGVQPLPSTRDTYALIMDKGIDGVPN
ncbi:BTAD domain-containing putative transcriptional regulator [Brevibacillus sp. SYSU BS000544]|uniref:BTAD domain-containing putative transcriptional regulator n=1 Tax=Brevibacillus sp. SYSU BS000544 TaxID=3416443 RepID=UPI003CE4E6F3